MTIRNRQRQHENDDNGAKHDRSMKIRITTIKTDIKTTRQPQITVTGVQQNKDTHKTTKVTNNYKLNGRRITMIKR